jgi:hypothetical protein
LPLLLILKFLVQNTDFGGGGGERVSAIAFFLLEDNKQAQQTNHGEATFALASNSTPNGSLAALARRVAASAVPRAQSPE